MKVLGIDPGTRTTGYGIVRLAGGGRLELVTAGEITPTPSAPLSERLLAISDGLRRVSEEFRPESVSIESVFFAKNVKSALMLGHARGVAFLSAAAFGLPVFEYAPTKIKQAVVGYGAASKEQVQKMVTMLLKIDTMPGPDASDALATAICHIHHSGSAYARATLKDEALPRTRPGRTTR